MNGTLSGIIAIFLWSFTSALIVFTGEVPGFLLSSVTFFLGFVTLTLYQLVSKKDIISFWRQPVGNYFFVGSGVVVYTVLLYMSFKIIPALEANSLNYLWPILLVALSSFLYKKKVSLNILFGILMGALGTFLLFFSDSKDSFFSDFQLGHLTAIIAALIWTIYSVLAAKKEYPQGVMAPVFFFSAIICFFLHKIFEQPIWPEGWEWMAVIALGIGRISYPFWDYGMKKGDAVLLASCAYLIPLFSTIFLILIGTKPNSIFIGLGAFLIVSGCLVVNVHNFIKLFNRS